ncbi:DUF305 domain-containing protein [Janthinobacterium sp. MDB2-8]|uniref:DUF305 domain-containing protein n=1 Tax=Janthinobacterium sp. MDB2-8 TaxID=1259338 RepID=UPI003F28D6B1
MYNNKISGLRIARNLTCSLAVAISAYTIPVVATAQTSASSAGKMEMGANASGDASMKMRKSMDDMHEKMGQMKMTGDVDHDFVMMMRSHHQAAIDMAQVEVDTGKDAAMISAAKKIIAAQKKEIAQFDAWMKKHPMK